MGECITFVGLDVHKQTITVALAAAASAVRCVTMAGSQTPQRR